MSGRSSLTLGVIYVNMALYAVSFQMQRPLEPFLVDTLLKNRSSSGAEEYSRLQSFFFVIQTIGSLLSGRLIDRIGFKNGFLINFAASALSYFILSQATSLPLLYLCKVPTAFQMGFLCAQIAVAQDGADSSGRVENLGRVSAAYTIGSIIGPYVGGFLGASGDYYYGAKLSCGASVLSLLITFLLPSPLPSSSSPLPSSSSSLKYQPAPQAEDMPSTAVVQPQKQSIIEVALSVWLLLSIKVFSNVANSISPFAQPLILKDIFALNEYQLGLTMSVNAIFSALVSALALGPLISLAKGDLRTVVSASLAGLVISFTVQTLLAFNSLGSLFSFSGGFYEYYASSLVIVMLQFVLSNALTAECTQSVEESSIGTVIGLEHSLFAGTLSLADNAFLVQY